MKYLLILFLALLGGLALAADRPNIVIILADDAGYSDIGCFGSEIQTPNLNRLASQGLRFSQFYNCALCGPSRAALMTGLQPHQVGVFAWTGLLNNRCATLPELLKQSGYATYAVGRLDMLTAEDWHDPANIAHHLDHFFGSWGNGAGNYFQRVRTGMFYRDGQPFPPQPDEKYHPDLITDYAVKYIEEAAANTKPFFLYVAQYAPHWPLQAKPEDIAKYRALYRKLGWDEARHLRHERLIAEGLLPKDCQLSPRDSRVPPWEEAQAKDWEAERMATYAAQVDALDQSVGRVMDALKRTKADANTLVIFLSDNGAADQAGPASLDKPGLTWRLDGTPTKVGNNPGVWPGPADNFVTSGPEWATVQNAPFRKHKFSNHEGGIATPCIAWWPGLIARGGAITDQVGHIADLMPTCLELAGVKYPAEFAGRKLLPLADQSLVPIFKGGTFPQPRLLGWNTGSSRALRDGNWKLVSSAKDPWELYDLATDRTELHDLASKHPDKVAELAAKWARWRAEGKSD
jgi:arylsulfatase